MSEHIWFQENLAGYCAGGLSIEERERFERHRVACSACARSLGELKGFDESMEELFAKVRPSAGWENRVIEKLRVARARRSALGSRWMRAAASAAAVVVFGVLGAALYGFVVEGKLPFPGEPGQFALGSLRMEANGILRPLKAEKYAQTSHEFSLDPKRTGKININTVWDSETLDALVDNGPAGAAGRDGEAKDQPAAAIGLGTGTTAQAKDQPERLRRELWEPMGEMANYALGMRGDVAKARSLNELSDKTSGLGELPSSGADKTDAFSSALGLIVSSPDPVQTSIYDGIIGGKIRRSGAVNQDAARKESNETTYFKPAMAVTKLDPGKSAPPEEAKLGAKREQNVPAASPEALLPKLAQGGEKGKAPKAQALPEKGQPENPPAQASRKIIRTGEMEFEIDGFDAAVAGITRLVNGVKGGFVGTVNSDKLPNGKVKGSIVVRMPPEHLDKFLLDVRQELGKSGELKSQRIGSQDVSKQYTDIESALRGARAMEERFLQIIKTGKGEIKDLVAAENALGEWRTKIERMEGEIRFYNNQVGLSTLTITLYEKEIQAPAALVVTERLQLQLEVDDVVKAQKAALAAVSEAKGRVTKSELKQHAAGQLQAILHFEVPPAAAERAQASLKALGIVTHQESDRSQETEGAGSQIKEIKVKQRDVKFEVVMYNVATFQPREVLTIKIVSQDVPAAYRKLVDAVTKAKGLVKRAQLNEQDRRNAAAVFHFDVLTQEKKAIDEALAEAGVQITRNAAQAAPGEAATDRKVGYQLSLFSADALPPREFVHLEVEVKDVDQATAAARESVKEAKGRIIDARTNYQGSGQTSNTLEFDVPLSARDTILRQLKGAGTVRQQTSKRNPQVPDNELAPVRFEVTLTSSGPIVPSDQGLWPRIRTSLYYSFTALSWSLMFVILGVVVVLPWMLLLWGAYKLVSKLRKKPAAGPAPS